MNKLSQNSVVVTVKHNRAPSARSNIPQAPQWRFSPYIHFTTTTRAGVLNLFYSKAHLFVFVTGWAQQTPRLFQLIYIPFVVLSECYVSQRTTSAPATGGSLEMNTRKSNSRYCNIKIVLCTRKQHKTTQSIFSQTGFIIQKSFETKELNCSRPRPICAHQILIFSANIATV